MAFPGAGRALPAHPGRGDTPESPTIGRELRDTPGSLPFTGAVLIDLIERWGFVVWVFFKRVCTQTLVQQYPCCHFHACSETALQLAVEMRFGINPYFEKTFLLLLFLPPACD